MKLIQCLVLAGALAASGFAAAHDDAYLATVKAPNGGQLRMAGPYHLELVLAPEGDPGAARVLVYVTDHAGAKVSTRGASGKALILSGAKKATVALVPHEDNALKAVAAHGAGPQAKVVVSVVIGAGAEAQQARFSLP